MQPPVRRPRLASVLRSRGSSDPPDQQEIHHAPFASRSRLVASVLAASAPLGAHDFWIEPTGFMADLGRVVGVKLRVGDDFHGDPVPRNDDADRALRRGGRRRPAAGGGPRGLGPGGPAARHGAGPDGDRLPQPPEPGDAAGRQVHAVPEEEGLDAIMAARARSQTSRARGPRDLLARGQEPGPLGRGGARARATARSGSPSSSWPSATRIRCGAARRCRCGSRISRRRWPAHWSWPTTSARRTTRLSVRSDRDGRAAFADRRTGRVAGEGGAHGAGARRLERRLGELLGVADVRDRAVSRAWRDRLAATLPRPLMLTLAREDVVTTWPSLGPPPRAARLRRPRHARLRQCSRCSWPDRRLAGPALRQSGARPAARRSSSAGQENAPSSSIVAPDTALRTADRVSGHLSVSGAIGRLHRPGVRLEVRCSTRTPNAGSVRWCRTPSTDPSLARIWVATGCSRCAESSNLGLRWWAPRRYSSP